MVNPGDKVAVWHGGDELYVGELVKIGSNGICYIEGEISETESKIGLHHIKDLVFIEKDNRKVRGINIEERGLLIKYYTELFGGDSENAEHTVTVCYFSVHENYMTGCPGYAGKVIVGVAEADPGITETFGFKSGKLFRFDSES